MTSLYKIVQFRGGCITVYNIFGHGHNRTHRHFQQRHVLLRKRGPVRIVVVHCKAGHPVYKPGCGDGIRRGGMIPGRQAIRLVQLGCKGKFVVAVEICCGRVQYHFVYIQILHRLCLQVRNNHQILNCVAVCRLP